MLYLKLRSNIRISDDIALASRELSAFFDEVSSINSTKYFEKAGIPAANMRSSAPFGFACKGLRRDLGSFLHSVNFIQEAWVKKTDPALPKDLSRLNAYANGTYYLFVPFMAAAELLEKTYNGRFSASNYQLLSQYLAGEEIAKPAIYHRAVNLQSSSTQHVHGLHKYKAKFFPRFVRSQIVTHIGDAPPNAEGMTAILDPFVGSGTALVEASLLGYPSFGLDIDKLSCEISETKIAVLNIEHAEAVHLMHELEKLSKRLSSGLPAKPRLLYKFPKVISRKFGRWNACDEQAQHESQIALLRDFVSAASDAVLQKLLRAALSDALCKKFNIRMLGTGSGRFALEIANTDLMSFMQANIKNLMRMLFSMVELKKRFNISPAPSKVYNDNAKKMPIGDSQISLIVTSPPYLPASSGRENYLIGKAIAMTALDLVSEQDFEAIEQNSVGSIKALQTADDGGLPKSVYHLVDWLENDPLRNIKAKPVLHYYLDLKQALVETKRVLVEGGIAIYIIGKASTFYNTKTKAVVYKVDCDKIFGEIAESIGFRIVEKTDIELDKKNKNARPRSLDSYFESAFVLKKTGDK